MLLTIFNLPYYVKHDDIKALLQLKCGIEDIILDKILPHENKCKKVTVGLTGASDAAVVMRKLNGQFMDGNQLQVVAKTKNQQSSSSRSPAAQSAMPSLMQSYGQYGSNWSQDSNFGSNFGPQGSNFAQQGLNFGQLGLNFSQQGSNSDQQGSNFTQQGQNFGQQGSNSGQLGSNFTQQGQNYGQQGSNSGQQGPNFNQQESKYNPQGPYYSSERSRMMNQHLNAAVPPLLGYNPVNVMAMYANPSAYLMNRSAFQSQPTISNPNMGYQTCPIDIDNNQKNKEDLLQECKSVNQSQQSGGPTRWGRDSKRGNPDPKWDNNRGSRWDATRDSVWESNRRPEGNNNCPGLGWNANRQQESGNDRDSKRGNENKPERGNNRDLKRGNGNESEWGNSRNLKRGNGNEPNWDNNRGSKWDSNRDQGRENSRYSKWERSRDSNRDSNRPNQSAGGSSRGHDSSYGNNQNFSRSLVENNNQNQKQKGHGTDSSGKNINQRYNLRGKSGPNDSPANNQAPPAKRARFADGKQDVPVNRAPPGGSTADNQNDDVNMPTTAGGRQIYNAKMKRAQLAELWAKIVSTDMGFEYEVANRKTLKAELKRALTARMDKCFKSNYNMSIKQMKKIYSNKYDKNSHWVILRDTLKLLGGKMISKYDNAAAQEAARLRKAKPQKAPLVGYSYGNLKVDYRYGQQRGANAGQDPNPGQKKQTTIPLAQIPGRIPYYPKGDKQLFKAQKKQNADLYKTDPGIVLKSFKPELQAALEEETDLLSQAVLEECEDSEPENAKFCEQLKAIIPDYLKKVLKLNVVRRIKPEEPFVVRLYAKPPIKREPLEKFLIDSNFKVACLRRLKHKNYYVANCETVDVHDQMCLMGPMQVGMSTVTIRPFQMAGVKAKVSKGAILQQRSEIREAQIEHSDRHLAKCLERPYLEPANNFGDKTDAKEEPSQETGAAAESPSAELNIKNNDDQKPEVLDATEETPSKQTIKKEKYLSPIKCCQTTPGKNIKTELATEAKIENIKDNINEEADCLPIIEDREGDGFHVGEGYEGEGYEGEGYVGEGYEGEGYEGEGYEGEGNEGKGYEGDPNDDGRSESEMDNKAAIVGDAVNLDDAVDDIDFADLNEDDLEDW